MKVTIIHSVGVIFFEFFFVYGLLKTIVSGCVSSQKRKVPNSVKALLVGVVCAGLLWSHYEVFNRFVKERSYLDVMEIERAYASDKLARKARHVVSMHHPDHHRGGSGSSDNDTDVFNELIRMRNVLSDKEYSRLYDVFGEFDAAADTLSRTQYEGLRDSLTLAASVDLSAFYVATFVVSIVVTYGAKFGSYRLISTLLIAAFFVQEAVWVYSVEGDEEDELNARNAAMNGNSKSARKNKFEVESDFYDDFWPTLTIFERTLLLRLILLGTLTGIRLLMDILKKDVKNVYEDQLEEEIDLLYIELSKQTSIFVKPQQGAADAGSAEGQEQQQQAPKVFPLNEFVQNKAKIEKIKTLATKRNKQEPSDGVFVKGLKTGFQITLSGLFLYQVISIIFGRNEA